MVWGPDRPTLDNWVDVKLLLSTRPFASVLNIPHSVIEQGKEEGSKIRKYKVRLSFTSCCGADDQRYGCVVGGRVWSALRFSKSRGQNGPEPWSSGDLKTPPRPIHQPQGSRVAN
jgi:hypothetical protein